MKKKDVRMGCYLTVSVFTKNRLSATIYGSFAESVFFSFFLAFVFDDIKTDGF